MTEFYEDYHSEKSNLCLLGHLLQSEETGFEDFRLVKTLISFTVRVILGFHVSWTFLWIWVATRHLKPSLSLIDSPMQNGPIGLRRKVRALKKRALLLSELWWTYHVEEVAVWGNPGRQLLKFHHVHHLHRVPHVAIFQMLVIRHGVAVGQYIGSSELRGYQVSYFVKVETEVDWRIDRIDMTSGIWWSN